MIYLRQTVIGQIKSAQNEKEIEDVIDRSIQRLKIKNVHGHIIQRFIIGMGSSLDQAKAELVSEKVKQNIDTAISVFRKLQKPQ